ncbi:PREDICTED: protein YLS3 [Lupinus angustifolius]|uniref:protein YLS3 n=1 Tax=Lupinus angustifolius TaxID=3871 RepID=UPI00092F4E9F|nr:PREDICTED: protein YLS3 [Lupinus angustifolius]
MASLKYSTIVPIFCQIIFLLIISYPSNILSQDSSSSSPNIAQCASNILPLIPCAPFVQGAAQSPGQQCCDNLKQLYNQEPQCLCFLLNDTTLGSFPINRTLALKLPDLCTLQVNISACPGEHLQVPVFPPSSASQIPFGTKNNSTVAASPTLLVAPRPSMMAFGFGISQAMNLKAENNLAILITTAILLLQLVPY